ncbi:MAG: Spy/CpxP family protein refolding chaperone [Tepidisphaeraceae bacterium]
MTKLVVIAGFMIAFAAGLVVGLLRRESQATPVTPAAAQTRAAHPDRSWLVNELCLTAQQEEQMRQIWSATAQWSGKQTEERRRQYRKERDEAILALVPAGDRPRYAAIQQTCAEQTAALDREWRNSYQAAVEKTKQMLTPEQREKYEAILKRHTFDRGPRGGDRSGREVDRNRQDGDRATSRPEPGRSN